jgi:pilus assembly protein Flp/PilA
MLYNYLRMRNWLRRDEGQDLTEYALLLGLIAIICIAAVTVLGQEISQLFSAMGSAVGSWPPFGG